jgi:hypothetical protein
MNNTLHTWQISFGNIVDQNKKTICFLPERKNNDNAHLISAAPDLLSALIELERVESSPHSETVRYLARENAREAIRKAKGEA